MKFFALVFVPIVASCAADPFPNEEIPNSCSTLAENAICTIEEDPNAVARCIDGACVAFGCDICPRLPCRTIGCSDSVCRWAPMPDGSACAAFSDPFDTIGNVGTCMHGSCTGSFDCESNANCPAVECVFVSCSAALVCMGHSTLPGSSCQLPSGKFGSCFNYTCTETE